MVLVGLSLSIEKNRNGYTIGVRLKLFKFYWRTLKVINTRRGLGKAVPPRIVEADPSKSPTADNVEDLTVRPNPIQLEPEDI